MIYLKIYLNRRTKKMHGHQHGQHQHGHGHCGRDGESRSERWGAGRHRRHGRFGGSGFGGGRHGGFGEGGEDMMRARRMLAQGDLRLIALALIAEAPRHGYEIIKLLEEKTADWYSPSPGIVYPTLTYLEEAGYVTASTEGSKKLYTITDEGRAYLKANRELVDVVLDRLAAFGERVNRWRRNARGEREDRGSLPPLVEATLDHLREAVGKRLEGDAEAEARLVEILARTVTELQSRN
jgi:DNA-binding PadR family transcriptional regulator